MPAKASLEDKPGADARSGGLKFWEAVYSDGPVEQLPWYSEDLDSDLARELEARGLMSGSFLDIGTGPGTQASALVRRGFRVTATDLSPVAIELATRRFSEPTFITDNILETRLTDRYDLVFDRGCFHVLPPERRLDYVNTVHRLLAPSGLLFLKTFSDRQPDRERGPYRFSEEELIRILSPRFTILSCVESIYQGTLDPPPRALFAVCRSML